MDFAMQSNVGPTEFIQSFYLLLTNRLSYLINSHSDPTTRKWLCTLLGFFNVTVMLNKDVWHFHLAIVLAILLIKVTGARYCHIASFTIMFSYLIGYRMIFYLEGVLLPQMLTVVQSLAVMVVTGIGFEINMAYKRKINPQKDSKVDPTDDDLTILGFFDIFHYVYNFATINTGPYIRYQVYSDFINLPFSRAVKRTKISVIQICLVAPLCLLMYIALTEIWPSQYSMTEEFLDRSFIYRLSFCVIQWFRYRVFLYSSFGCIRCCSVTAGLGAYPVENKAVSAHGPTVNNNHLREITFDEAKEMDMDMETTTIIDNCRPETAPTVRGATRAWNKCVSYWLKTYIYQSTPKALGPVWRTVVTLIISWLWHNVYPSNLLSCLLCAYYYIVEFLYIGLQRKLTGRMVNVMNVIFWISRHYYWSYVLMPFFLLDMDKVLIYYSSTYYLPIVFTVVMHLAYVFVFSKMMKLKKT